MRETRRRLAPALLLCASAGCSSGSDLVATYAGSRFLTVEAAPGAGTSGTSAPPTVCTGTMAIEDESGTAVRGRFDRTACSGSAAFAADVRGEFTGTVESDGSAIIVFSGPPLPPSEAVRTSSGCPDAPAAAGPYRGRITRASIALQSRFRLECAGRPPIPPAFDVEYRIEATR
jgi:hypothetical protein